MKADNFSLVVGDNYNGAPIELIVREGAAIDQEEKSKVRVSGTIYAALLFAVGLTGLKANKTSISDEALNGLVDAAKASPLPGVVTYNYGFAGGRPFIKLDTEPAEPIKGAVIEGALAWNKDLDAFHINEDPNGSGVYSGFTAKALINTIKKHAGMFNDMSQARSLIKTLQNFDAVFTTTVKQADDRHGNVEEALNQSIDIKRGELPTEINLTAPLYYGTPDVNLKLEIELDRKGNQVVYSFFCLELEPTKTATVVSIIDQEVSNLKQLYTVIEQA